MPTPVPLQSTLDGRAHDLVDVINHLAEWLEPRRMTIEAANVVQSLVDTAVGAGDSDELDRLTTATRRWVRANDRADIR